MSAIWPLNKGAALVLFRRADEAEPAIRLAYELNGNSRVFNENMADIHNIRGEYDKALEALASLQIEEFNLTRKAIALYGAGQVEEANAMLVSFEQIGIPEARLGIAQAYAMRGDNDRAFELLESIKNDIPADDIVYDSYTRILVDDPRWKPFVDSLKWHWDYEY